MSVSDRLIGSFWGAIVGDAIGVPYEFIDPSYIDPAAEISFDPPSSMPRYHKQVPPGTWSDDGAQIFALADAYVDAPQGRLDIRGVAKRLLDWRFNGAFTPDGVVFDVGHQTNRALMALRSNIDPLEAAELSVNLNGNGSLMRVLPVALRHTNKLDMVIDAHVQSALTHPHPRSQICCALYCLWIHQLLSGQEIDWLAASVELGDIYRCHNPGEWTPRLDREFSNLDYLIELDEVLHPHSRNTPQGTGYVMDTLWSAFHAMQANTFRDAISRAIHLGFDTDTTACVTGGLAGAKFGFEGIPAEWIQGVRDKERAQELINQFIGATPARTEEDYRSQSGSKITIQAVPHSYVTSFLKVAPDVAVLWISDANKQLNIPVTGFGLFEQFAFDDIHPGQLDFLGRAMLGLGLHSFKTRLLAPPTAAKIVSTLAQVGTLFQQGQVRNLVIACHYGRSRSAAVAQFAEEILGGQFNLAGRTPNPWVTRLLKEAKA